MKKLRTRALSWLLTIAMVLSMVPVSAGAAGTALAMSPELTFDADGNAHVKLTFNSAYKGSGVTIAVVPAFATYTSGAMKDKIAGGTYGASDFAPASIQGTVNGVVAGLPAYAGTHSVEVTEENKVFEFSTSGQEFAYSTIKTAVGSDQIYDGADIATDQTVYPYMVYVRVGGNAEFYDGPALDITDPNPDKTPAELTASDLVITFDGTDPSASVTFTNSATGPNVQPAVIQTAALSGGLVDNYPEAGIAAATPTGGSIAQGASEAVNLTATNWGNISHGSAVLTITYTDGVNDIKTKEVNITLNSSVDSLLTASATAVSFTGVRIGNKTDYTPRTAAVTLSGALTADATEITIGAINASGWSATTDVTAVNGTDSAVLTITPPDTLTADETVPILIQYSDDNTYTYCFLSINATATVSAGTAPDLAAQETTLDWGSIHTNSDPGTMGTTIDNKGNGTATITAVALSGDFDDATVAGIKAGDTIAAGDSAAITVDPTASTTATTSSKSGTLTITYDGGKTVVINLAATVTDAPTHIITIDNTTASDSRTVDYTAATTATVTISNAGNQPLTNLRVVADTVGANNFDLVQPAGSLAVGAGTTSFTVTPKLSLPVGEYVGTFTVKADSATDKTFTYTFNVTNKVATEIKLGSASATYDGTDKRPTVEVWDKTATPTKVAASNYTTVWTKQGDASWTDSSSNMTGAGTYTCTVTMHAGSSYANPTAATFTINKAAAAAAPTLSSVDPTTVGGTGSITITDYASGTSYEYQKGSGSWTNWPAGATLSGTGITADTYKVRVKYDAANQQPSTEATKALSDPTEFSVTVNTTLDTGYFTGTPEVTLTNKNDGSKTFKSNMDAAGKAVIADVPNGTYAITVAGATGGGDVTVSNADVIATTLAYYNFTLTVDTNGTRGGSARANGIYISGTALNTTVTAKAGYIFDKWTAATAGGTVIATAPTTLLEKTDLYANFKAATPTLGTLDDKTVTYGDAASTYVVPAGDWESGATAGTITYSATGLPDGVTFDAATHTFTIRPTAVNTTGTTVTVKAANSVDSTKYVEQTFDVIVNKATPALTLTQNSGGPFAPGLATASAVTATGTYTYHDGSAWQTVTKGDISTIGTVSYAPATLTKGTSIYTGTLAINDAYKDRFQNTSSTVTVVLAASYDITVNINKGGSLWSDRSGTITLDGTNDYSGTLINGTVKIVGVPAGTYDIKWGTDTVVASYGVTNDAAVAVNYYTVSVDNTGKGVASATGVSLTATGHEADTGVFLTGSTVGVTTVTPKNGYISTVANNTGTVGSANLTLKPTYDHIELSFSDGAVGGTYSSATLTGDTTAAAAFAATGTSTNCVIKYTATLPFGLSMTEAGAISGTPNAAGTDTATITATAYESGGTTATGATATATYTFAIAKGTQAAPALSGTDCDVYGANDGTLTIGSYSGTAADYQWSATGGSTDSEWSLTAPGTPDASGKITGVAAGTYYVRLKATANLNASPASAPAVTIAAGTKYTGAVVVKENNTAASGYTVKLVGKDGASVEATWDTGSSSYKTTANQLSTGNEPYKVMVDTVKGTGTALVDSTATVTANGTVPTVNYFVVNFTSPAALSHVAGSSKQLTGPFNVTAATTIGAAALTSGTSAVLAGTSVTFTTAAWSNNEYALSWAKATGLAAATATKTYNAVADSTDTVAATLTQKSYTVTGTAEKGITGVTLKDKTSPYTVFNATVTGTDTKTYTFTVAAGTYELIEVLATGASLNSSGTNYSNPADVSVSGIVANGFNILTKTATYNLTAKDGSGETSKDYALNYHYTQPDAVTVTITNTGDSAMTGVKLAVSDSGSLLTTPLTVSDPALLTTGITLGAGATATFTYQVADGLDAMDKTAATITVEGTGWDNVTASVAYTVNVAVTAIPLTTPTIAVGSGGLKPGTTLTASFAPTDKGLTENDVEYQWYRNGTAIGLATAKTYELTAADEGAKITVKTSAKTGGNASGSATSAETGAVGYTGGVKVLVDGEALTAAGGYVVQLENSGTYVAADQFSNGVFSTAAGALDASKSYAVYVQRIGGSGNAGVAVSGLSVALDKKTETVNFYTVKFTDKAAVSSTGTVDILTAQPGVTAKLTDAPNTAINSNSTVLTGTSVTFTVDDATNNWHSGALDYTLTWNNSITTAATKTGVHTYTGKLTDDIAATLTQNTYAVKGSVDVVSRITAVTLTETGGSKKVFNGTQDATNKTYSFQVPKGSYTIGYTLAAEAVLGSDSIIPNPLNVTGENLTAFSMKSTGAAYSLSVSDSANTANADTDNAGATTNTMNKVTWNASNPTQITVKVKNTGNQPLKNVTVTATPSAEANFTVTTTSFTGGTTLAVNEEKSFTIDAVVNGSSGMPAGTHTLAVAVNAKTDSTVTANQTLKTATYNVSLTVDKAAISTAAVTGVTAPVYNVKPVAFADLSVGSDVYYTATGLTWNGANPAKFAAGTAYKAVVTLTADDNHYFVDTIKTGKIDSDASAKATVAANGVSLTLEKTFKPTVPTLGVSLAATAFDTATATFTLGKQASGATYEIKYLITDGAAPTVENQLTGTLSSGATASATNLTPNKAYKVYALARVTVDGQTSDATEITASAADTTYYKVVTAYTGHNGSGDSAPAITPLTTAISSVKGGTTLAINAVATKGYWKFDEWTAGAGTVPAKGTASGSFTAPAASGNGTNGIITLTAAFVGSDLTLSQIAYPDKGEYGRTYTGQKPTVSGGSTNLSFAVVAPTTRAAASGLPAGLKFDTATGAVSGKPEAVGEYAYAIKVTDGQTGTWVTSSDMTLTISAATPKLTNITHTAGTYYVGNARANSNLSGTATVPVLTTPATGSAAGVWTDTDIGGGAAAAGAWSFTTPGNFVGNGSNADGSSDYGVTFTPSDTTKYKAETGKVSITSYAKTLGIKFIDSKFSESAAYGVNDKTLTFKMENVGNQSTGVLSYTITGTDAASFSISSFPTNALAASGDKTGEIAIAIADNLAVAAGKTYTATLTVTGANTDGTGPRSANTAISYTVTPLPIAGTTVTGLTAPVKGAKPVSTVAPAADAKYDVTSVTWTPTVAAGGTFATGTVYKADIVLTAKENYTFTSGTYGADALTGVSNAITGTGEKNTVKLTKTFPATGAGAITVTAQATDHESGKITSITSPSAVPVEYYYLAATTAPTLDEVKAAAHVTGAVSNGNAVATNVVLTGLSAGTTYKVYVLEKIGLVWGAALTESGEFTTDYEIQIGSLANGTVAPAATFHVKAGATAKMTATAASGYEFKGWTLAPADGGSIEDKAVDAVLTPSKNLTVTAAFGGLPALQVTGDPYGNQVSQGYDAATINVYLNGDVENIGIGGMVDKLAAKVVAKGAALDAAANDTFTVKFGSDNALAPNANTSMEVHPKAGLTSTGGIAGVYAATIWVYEVGRESTAVSVDVSIVIIPAGDPAFKPVEKNWDLKSGATNTVWTIAVTENSSTIGVPTRNGVALAAKDYSYQDNGATGVLTLTKAYLDALAAEAGRKAGDTVEIVVPAVNGGNTKNTKLTLTYVDTTPTVTAVEIKPNSGFASGETLTAIAKVSTGAAITSGQVLYTWYHTGVDGKNVLQAKGVSSTYTLKAADAGKTILVVAEGDGTNFRSSATSFETDPSGYKITVTVEQIGGKAPGTAVPTSQKVAKGGTVQLMATPKAGFKFKSWDVSGVGGSFTAGSAASATATVKPAKDGEIKAVFEAGGITYKNAALTPVKFNANTYSASVATATSTATGSFTYTSVNLPIWLELDEDGALSMKSGARVATNVIDKSTTEVSFTVTATQEGSDAAQNATFTIDVAPGDLFADAQLSYSTGKTIYVGDVLAAGNLKNTDVSNAAGTKITGAWKTTAVGAKITVEGTYGYSFTFTPTAPQDALNYAALAKDVSITASASTASITAKEQGTSNSFKLVTKEYLAGGTAITVEVKNTGEQNVTLAKAVTESNLFDISDYAGGATPALAPGGSTTFTITPKANVPVGEYKDIVFTVNTADIAGKTGPTTTFRVSLTVTKKEIGGVIAISNLDEPTTGSALDTSVTTNATNDATYGKTYTAESVVWTPADGAAAEGKSYTVTITLKPNGNYKFPVITDAGYTLGGKKVSESSGTMTVEDGADGKVIITKRFDKTKLTNITANVTKPVADATPAVPTTSGDNYTVTGKWKDKAAGTDMGAGDKFVKDKVYTVEITVTPKPGFSFEEAVAKIVAKLVEDGTTVSITTGITRNPDGTITIKKDYTAIDKATPPPVDPPGGGGGGGGGSTAFTVTYDLRDLGTSKDKTTESVVSGKKPAAVPAVTANKGLTFKGWSLENPAKVAEPKLVDPKTHTVKEDTTFYAVYDGHIIAEHEHYIKGLPNGNFGPAQEITRAEVATIIARACLDSFEEGKDYGDDSYSDVSGHWAESAIAYCSLKGVFRGTDQGTFQPDRPITRQEFALVFARLAGLKRSVDMPFSDIGTADTWALDGIYTAYTNGWVIGYGDGTFKPQNNIARSEAVKIVDAYLNRGVNKDGVKSVIQDVKQWPDVPETYWAYYEIMEASNDHTCYYADEKKPPEVWTKAYIEKASWGE